MTPILRSVWIRRRASADEGKLVGSRTVDAFELEVQLIVATLQIPVRRQEFADDRLQQSGVIRQMIGIRGFVRHGSLTHEPREKLRETT